MNIAALLHARHQTKTELAKWCRKTDPWIGKILKGERQARMQELDRIAEFFGIAPYQLFQPGISSVTERRGGRDRRSGQDRRVSHAYRAMLEVQTEVDRVRPKGRFPNVAGKEVG